jgi:hypothetical protein
VRFLVSCPPEVQQTGEWAPAGEPVVPWFPATQENVFLSCSGFKRSLYAVVAEGTWDPDVLARALVDQYPGLPKRLCENYVLQTALRAAKVPVGTKLRIFVTRDSATLQPVGTDKLITMWDTQPL